MAGRLSRLLHGWPWLARQVYRVRFGPIGPYFAYTEQIPSWLGRDEALALADACLSLPPDALVVEIGSFLGKSSIVLAGARRLAGGGRVHCVDPFDASGESYSSPVYRGIAETDPRPLLRRFQANVARAGLTGWIDIHEGTAEAVARTWTSPIDMLFLDGDQSPAGARLAYERWQPFLKIGGVIALHNSTNRPYASGHDGHHQIAVTEVRPPQYDEIHGVESTTFARRRS